MLGTVEEKIETVEMLVITKLMMQGLHFLLYKFELNHCFAKRCHSTVPCVIMFTTDMS